MLETLAWLLEILAWLVVIYIVASVVYSLLKTGILTPVSSTLHYADRLKYLQISDPSQPAYYDHWSDYTEKQIQETLAQLKGAMETKYKIRMMCEFFIWLGLFFAWTQF